MDRVIGEATDLEVRHLWIPCKCRGDGEVDSSVKSYFCYIVYFCFES